MTHTITAAEAFRRGACKDRTTALLVRLFPDDAPLCELEKPILLATILEHAGLNSALWAASVVDPIATQLLACDCAEHAVVIYEDKYPGDNRPRNAIETKRRFLRGGATAGELATAQDAAWDAQDAARAARDAARAARDAARAAAHAVQYGGAYHVRVAARAARAVREAEREWQTQKFLHYFGGDK